MSSPRTPHGEHAMTKDGRWKVTFNLVALFYRVRSGKQQRLRYTALNGTSSSARAVNHLNLSPRSETLGTSPRLDDTLHRDSSRCLARALTPSVCDTNGTGPTGCMQEHAQRETIAAPRRGSRLRACAATLASRTASESIGITSPAITARHGSQVASVCCCPERQPGITQRGSAHAPRRDPRRWQVRS
jgi:hypothetical protein